MFYKQTCPTGHALDVALEQMQKYRGIIIGNTCTVESGITVFFQTRENFEQYKQSYARRLGDPAIVPVANWSLSQVKQHFQAHAPALASDQIMSAKAMRTFFNQETYAWIDASLKSPQDTATMHAIATWRDQLASDLSEGTNNE